MKTPLNDAIREHREHISYHTPAHSGVIVDGGLFSVKDDITELPYSDNLHCPSGVLKESERLVSEAYGADHTFFVTTGATTAVHIALHACRGKTVLIAGNAHVSVFNAARLYGGNVFYTGNIDNLGHDIQSSHADVVVVTSPDYCGNILNLQEIHNVCSAENVILVIDASHGSHFAFCEKLPVPATEYGDIVIHSAHKTLPALTGAALLHTTEKWRERVQMSFNTLHSTSPSYLILASLERAVALMSEKGEKIYRAVIDVIDAFKDALPAPFTALQNDDPTRLVISSPYCEEEVKNALEQNNIYPEAAFDGKIVFIVTPFNCPALPDVLKVLINLKNMTLRKEEAPVTPIPLTKLSYHEEFIFVPLDRAAGKTAYREAGIYPPGVPRILSGQIIQPEDISFLKKNAGRTFGLDNGMLAVVK